MWTLGSANTLKTYEKLNQRCIPQPLSMTGHPAWGDPLNHPCEFVSETIEPSAPTITDPMTTLASGKSANCAWDVSLATCK